MEAKNFNLPAKLKQALVSGSACVHCGSKNTELKDELEYDDGADEPNTSNNLIKVEWLECKDCGDHTHCH